MAKAQNTENEEIIDTSNDDLKNHILTYREDITLKPINKKKIEEIKIKYEKELYEYNSAIEKNNHDSMKYPGTYQLIKLLKNIEKTYNAVIEKNKQKLKSLAELSKGLYEEIGDIFDGSLGRQYDNLMRICRNGLDDDPCSNIESFALIV